MAKITARPRIELELNFSVTEIEARAGQDPLSALEIIKASGAARREAEGTHSD